ncbi:ribonuclease P protein component 4 [Candidatus Nanohalovita haloferacivicina]|uniref:ribonuclease P protein component 4 n=1 Tax=Candidatus Nanohalovita haloferacivicina TaxID=2978046 RepID=UPI00325FA84B|nr:Ribonuclease P protein subunit RPR2 [Candidatus Nanohalobia archaeon BNXNv]
MAKTIAEERIERLFTLAEKRIGHEDELADRYVELARKIGMKEEVSIPSDLKKKFCSNCYSYMKPGRTCEVRIKSDKSKVEYTCSKCGNIDRYGY